MSKKTAQKRTRATKSVRPPLQAIALSQFADPELNGTDPKFLQAYAAMPALIDDLIRRHTVDAVFGFLDKVTGLGAARTRAERAGRVDDRMVNAIRAIKAIDPDLASDFTTPILHGAFVTGLAFAAYVLLDGLDGAR